MYTRSPICPQQLPPLKVELKLTKLDLGPIGPKEQKTEPA